MEDTNQNTFEFHNDGIQIKYNFLTDKQIEDLRNETEFLFSKNSLFGHGYSVRLSNFVSEIPYPTAAINSVNLLEVSIDIANEIEKLGFKDYKLAHVALYNEANNPSELVWHSDMRNGGLIRAQIVIRGGGTNSGAFKYYKGSQKVVQPDVYYPSTEYLNENKENLVVCDKKNGSLFLINTLGFHSKCVCMDTRTSFMFDFLPKQYILENPNDCSSDIRMTSSKLTDKVIENIQLFNSGVKGETHSVNTPDAYKFNKLFGGANFKDAMKYGKLIVKRFIGKGN